MDTVRCLLKDSGLPDWMWTYAMDHATDIINLIPKKDNVMSPYEKHFGRKPDIDILKIFGTECYAKVPEELGRKLDDKSEKCYYLGSGRKDGVKGYKLVRASDRTVFYSRDVVFNEKTTFEETPTEVKQKLKSPPPNNMGMRKSKRNAKEPERFAFTTAEHEETIEDTLSNEFAFIAGPNKPQTYEEAMSGDDSANWKAARDEELRNLTKNKTWVVVK
jgi:hypothetical protein